MRVLVTGATGFVGAWTAKAVADAGHELRVLARSTAKVEANLTAIGVVPDDVVVGDMTDAESVDKALYGCDAVVHAAALVSLKRSDAAAMLEANLRGAQLVVGGAVDRGVASVVHVSSVSALYSPGRRTLTTELAPGTASSGYARSKSAVEDFVRGLQGAGAPVAVTYPGGVIGPPAGTAAGETTAALVPQLRFRVLPCTEAGYGVVDVRDVAAVHAALIQPGGARRYLCGGHHVTTREMAATLTAVTGRRIVAAPFPSPALRALGRVADRMPFDTVLTAESMTMYTQFPEIDDAAVLADLGIAWRPAAETMADAIRGLHRSGMLPAALAGRLAQHG